MTTVYEKVKAKRGLTLRCKGWRQEGLLRMLENNLENAEDPSHLIIYGGNGQCARNWECFHAIVESLKALENDETLVMQSGMPVAVFKTSEFAPKVIMANTNFVQANWERYYQLRDANLICHGQYTAGPWEYIGTQGVLQGTYEILSIIACKLFGGPSLKGHIVLTAGAGGMGGNQGKATTMLGGVIIIADADERVVDRRINKGFIDCKVYSFAQARGVAEQAAREGRALSVALIANAADVFEEAMDTGFVPDVLMEMCPCHDPSVYIPSGYDGVQAEKLRAENREEYLRLAYQTMLRQLRAMNRYHAMGVECFEYGTSIRKECMTAGMPYDEAMQIEGFMFKYMRPQFCQGRGPFRWLCLSGEESDLTRLDDLVFEMFPEDDVLTNWIRLARASLPIEGLPARVCFMAFGQRRKFALRVNELVATGEIGPVSFTRDNLDTGSIVNPLVETEQMKDGSDYISDWVYLNGLLNAASMADLVAIQANGSMGYCYHTGVTMVADGTKESTVRLNVCMNSDSGIGIVRHAQAGYEDALAIAQGRGKLTVDGIKIPILWTRACTRGPESPQAMVKPDNSELM